MTDPRQAVLIYDGHCRFCIREAARIQRWVGNPLRLESFRDPGVIDRYPGLSAEQCEAALQLVEPDGGIRSGAAAVFRALALNPRLAPVTWIYSVPGLQQLFDAGYRVVARNRFRVQGRACPDGACRTHGQAREPPPGRAVVRDLFLRTLGAIFLVAFVSLYVQVDVLYGSRGLLPMRAYLDALGPAAPPFNPPTLLWIDCSDTAMHVLLGAGVLVSLGLTLNVAPRYCLIAAWGLYLSFATVGQAFLSFQWDNLLLESAFCALFVTPPGLRPRRASSPHPIGVFLMQWLLFRLYVESGAAKWLSHDPTWRDLTAMVNYYETAPIPTWVGWYAHQMPLWAHKLTAAFTYVVEGVVPFLIWGPRALRVAACALMVSFQVVVITTGNYGYFNYLSAVLCLWGLDDGHLAWVVARCGRRWAQRPRRVARWGTTAALAGVALVLVSASLGAFARFAPVLGGFSRTAQPVIDIMGRLRSLNIYHLFASMTLVRNEVVIEGSADGTTWESYEFRYKPGDVDRPPPFVAPHQPRVDFQLWFLRLRGRAPSDPYFRTLLRRLFEDPTAVAPLFNRNPFPTGPPTYVRLGFYRYRFTDAATRTATGAWWQRQLVGYSPVLTAATVPR